MREIMAELGLRTVDEMVGKVELLRLKQHISNWKYKKLDLSPILYKEPTPEGMKLYKSIEQDHEIAEVLDRKLIEYYPVSTTFPIINTDRATGTMLSNEISKKYKGEGLPEGTIKFRFRGSAGQSFGAFGAKGIAFTLEGEANDYFGKGLSGGRLVVVPDRESLLIPHESFAVRNSGVKTVVEGIGDHGCEYMTGGLVIVLGDTGKNFAAGMSGGVAYVIDQKKQFN